MLEDVGEVAGVEEVAVGEHSAVGSRLWGRACGAVRTDCR
jgi:hypothetical protein